MMKKSVLVGFSGGVDSCVAALLLKEQGFDVTAVTLDLTGGIPSCAQGMEKTIEDAREAAKTIGVKHIVSSEYRGAFSDAVVDSFAGEYLRGRTPNPCVICNPRVKFKALFSVAGQIGCELVATGHYARGGFDERYNTYVIRRAKSEARDQSYMLYRLSEYVRERVIFPLGGFEKEQVRALAENFGLKIAKKPDSQENCFIPDNDHAAFIERYTGQKALAGDFIDAFGNIIGRHNGIIRYTIGQRKGLGVSFGERKFVTDIDAENNTVTLGSNEDLFSDNIYIEDIKTIVPVNGSLRAYAKIRSAARAASCEVIPEGRGLHMVFDEPVRAATRGQSAVLYDDTGVVLGGGIIS